MKYYKVPEHVNLDFIIYRWDDTIPASKYECYHKIYKFWIPSVRYYDDNLNDFAETNKIYEITEEEAFAEIL